jgi:hypothetical protein
MVMEDRDGFVFHVNIISAGKIRGANKLENRYGLNVG